MFLPVQGWGQVAIVAPEIADIVISGNSTLSTSDLKSQMHLKEKRGFSSGSFFNRHHLTREEKKLANYYTLHGFLDVQISDSVFVDTENRAYIYINVIEGKEYYLRDVFLSGNTVFTDAEYLELIEFQGGSKFNTFKIRENLIEMLALYHDNGYPLINIQDSVVVDDSVSLYINVKEGLKLDIGKINISDYEHISADIIRRELIIHTGDLYNTTNIEESKRRLYETSLFNSVNIRMGAVDADSLTIDLDVDVIPAKFRAFDLNLGLKQGYNEDADKADPVLSIGLSGSWYHNNLFDKSKRIRVETKVSSIYPSIFIPQLFKFDFFYVEPWLSKFRIPLTINPFYWYIYHLSPNNNNNYNNRAYGIRAITTYRWFRKIKVQSLAEWSKSTTIGNPDNEDNLYQEARKVGMKLTWDERDNFFYPHSGFKLVLEPGLVGYFLGGENDYIQLQSSLSSYWNLFKDVVFAHNINLATAIQKDEENPIPYEKRFFLGGNSSIRGYGQQELGPTELIDGVETPIGGKFRIYTNFELRFPIYKILGGEVFFDVGNLWSDMNAAKINELEAAYGFGFTIDTPIGPARIDYGIPVNSQIPFKNGQTHIAIAYAF